METLSELDKVGAELLKNMPEILQKGQEYGGDLMERFLSYHLITSSIDLFFGTVLLYISYICYKYVRKLIREDIDDEMIGPAVFMGAACGGVGMIISAAMIAGIIKILILPEIYIIEYFIK